MSSSCALTWFWNELNINSELAPFQNHFARLARKHCVESLLTLRVVKAMGDDRADVQAALQHHGHLVPGFIHLAAINSFYRQHREDHRVPVNGHFFFRYAQHGNFSAMAQVAQHVAESAGIAGHLQAHVKSFGHAELFLRVSEVALERVDGQGHAHLARQRQPVFIDIGDDDVTRAGVPRDRGGHRANGTRAGDEHVFAQHREGDRKSTRLNSSHLVISYAVFCLKKKKKKNINNKKNKKKKQKK